MTRDARTDRLFRDLTPVERGVMVLQAWKRGEHEDPLVRSTIPTRWAGLQFNRLIASMNAVQTRLGLYTVEVGHHVDLLVSEVDWFMSLEVWAQDVAHLGLYIDLHGKTPITASDHAALVEAERARMAPIQELAEEMVDRLTGWTAKDMERGDTGEEYVSEAAWTQQCVASEKQLRGLVADGTLRGRRTRSGFEVEVGSYCDWAGVPPFVAPDWGPPYEIHPDSEADAVVREQRWLEQVRDILQSVPRLRAARSAVESESGERNCDGTWGQLMRVRSGAAKQWWSALKAVEVILGEVGEREFDGEDPALPAVRTSIASSREKLESVRARFAQLGHAFEWDEPSTDEIQFVREIYDKGLELELRS